MLCPLQLKQEIGNIVIKLIQEYKGNQEDTLQSTWDDVQAKVREHQTLGLCMSVCLSAWARPAQIP